MNRLKKGSSILYKNHGVCQIADISTLKFNATEREYYILRPVNSKETTLYVPVDNEKLRKDMRAILTVEEIYELIHMIPEGERLWLEDSRARQAMYKEIFDRGDRQELVWMIHDIFLQKKERESQKKKLAAIDETAMKRAEKLIHEEFAFVMDIRLEEVAPFVAGVLGRN